MHISPWKLLKEKNLRPRKSMGQNFLIDPSTAEMIIRKSGVGGNDAVVEIGAGLGALTLPLAAAAKVVYAVEKDSAVAGVLEAELKLRGVDNVVLSNQDIFDVDLASIAAKENRNLMIFGNLPYYISSQVLIRLISVHSCIQQADLMFQKEVAQRLIAGPGTKAYGRLSVLLQYYADIRRTATVNAHLFWPAPKVDSEVLQFNFKQEFAPAVCDPDLFTAVVKAAFSRRRKTLLNAMSSSELNIRREDLLTVFNASGIDPGNRAESLGVNQFVELTNMIYRFSAS